jgi:hypothetical protein
MAMRTTIATDAAPTVPMRPRKEIPVRLRATSAMMTVEPANRTALPEVPFARAIVSATALRSRSWRRWRLMMNSE